MYQLFIANKNYSSWSLRPWLLLTELGIPFAQNQYLFDGPDNAETFRRIAPNGKVPCLHDDGLVVWDSLAIVEYLAERHPGVWPADAKARAYARCAAAEMHSGFTALRGYCPMNVGIRVQTCQLPLPDAAKAYVDRLLALPGMQAWQQAALQETSRDPSHEAESAAVGQIVADYRAV